MLEPSTDRENILHITSGVPADPTVEGPGRAFISSLVGTLIEAKATTVEVLINVGEEPEQLRLKLPEPVSGISEKPLILPNAFLKLYLDAMSDFLGLDHHADWTEHLEGSIQVKFDWRPFAVIVAGVATDHTLTIRDLSASS